MINFLSVRGFIGGNTPLVLIGLHCLEKKSLKSFAFSVQLKIKVLLASRGGILGALQLFVTLLINFQYAFQDVLGSFILFPKFV